jgi:hypothetical protein
MRGKEAESNLDWELAEDPKAGNPPSFMFPLNYLTNATQIAKDKRIIPVMQSLKTKVALYFSWFNVTLANHAPNLVGTFMWMDVGTAGALSSGLDDYPRGFRNASVSSVHSDL